MVITPFLFSVDIYRETFLHMKYFKIFESEEDYTEYIMSDDFIAPNVSVLRDCTRTWINGEQPEPEKGEYFAFIAREDATFSFTKSIQYSLDSGETWVTLAANTETPTVASGETIMWKNEATEGGTPNGIGTFSATGDFDAVGNTMSLIFGDDFNDENDIERYPHVFQSLFNSNTHIVNAEGMELPALWLSDSCYDRMFSGCTSLVTAPELPSEDASNYCYRSMFMGCTSLVTAPEIHLMYDTDTTEGYCQYMFKGCTALTNCPTELPALYLGVACYDSMFEGCTSLTSAPQLPAKELVSQCYNHMFNGCTNLNFIKAHFVTEPNSDYTHEWVYGVAQTGTFFKGMNAKWNVVGVNGVPSGWTILSFETVPLTIACKEYDGMEISFTPTVSGSKVYYSTDFEQTWNELNGTITANYNDNILFKGELTASGNNGIGHFTTSGSFNVYGNIMSLIYGNSFSAQTALKSDYNFKGLFEGNSGLTKANELVLPSTTLRPYCYTNMFKNCVSLHDGCELRAMSLAEGCYSYMFYGCYEMYEMQDLPATTLAVACYSHMYEESGLVSSKELPAENLVSRCYEYMFANTDMAFVQTNFLTEPGTEYTENWLYNVSNYGVFIYNGNATWGAKIDEDFRSESAVPDYTDAETGDFTWLAQSNDYKVRWVELDDYCGTGSTEHHMIYKKQVSYDDGETWADTDPLQTKDEILAYNSIYCGFISGDTDDEYDSTYIDTRALSGADLTFTNVEGAPNIKTDADGYVTEFSYTDASDDSPVMFNGNTTIDTDYHAFRTNGTNFKITLRAYCDGNDQVYRDGADDNLVNLFTLRGESGGSVTYADGFSFRISKTAKTRLSINGNAQGTGFDRGLGIDDDGSHLWYFKIYYIDGVLSIFDTRKNKYVPNVSPWNTSGKTCNFLLDDGCSAVLACAVKPDGSYYRYCKCKFFEFKLETLHDIYEWRQAPAVDFMCVGEDKYYKEYYELSRDGGDNWTRVSGTPPRQGALIEEGSEDCACHYFTIRSLANNNTINLKNNSASGTKNFSASTDGGETWTAITLAKSASATVATIQSGETILMKGDNETLGTTWQNGCYFRGSQNYEVEGNLASLLYSNGQSREVTGGTFNFAQLFSGDTHLISAENLELSSTVLQTGIYNCMFRGCTNLEKGPSVLPALELVSDCYGSMFEGCIKLEEAPIISATSIANGATGVMKKMFCMNSSSKITTPVMTKGPTLYLDGLTASNCCQQLCAGNGNLSEITIYATSVSTSGLNAWLQNVASSGTVYTTSSITLTSGTSGLPSGWTQSKTLG